MVLMTWKSLYSIGHELVDGHHKKLFDLVNSLYDQLLTGGGREAVDRALKELVDYTVYHFKAEEEVMREAKYPELESHMQQHKALLAKVTELAATFNQNQTETSMELVYFVRDWLTQHTTTTDRKIGQYLRSMQADWTHTDRTGTR